MIAATITGNPTVQHRGEQGQKSAHTLHRDVADAVRHMSKREGCAALASLYPHLTHRWFTRHWHRLTTMPPAELARVLSHSDVTGETAARRVDALRRVEEEVDPLRLLSASARRHAVVERIARREAARQGGASA